MHTTPACTVRLRLLMFSASIPTCLACIASKMPRHFIAPSILFFGIRNKGRECASFHREPKRKKINPTTLFSSLYYSSPPLPYNTIYTSIKMVKSAVLGFPRIGEGRAMKKVCLSPTSNRDILNRESEGTCSIRKRAIADFIGYRVLLERQGHRGGAQRDLQDCPKATMGCYEERRCRCYPIVSPFTL